MNTFYINKTQIKDNKVYIDGEDYHHIKNVLRIKLNEKVYLCVDSQRYMAFLSKYFDDKVEFEIVERIEGSTESAVDITLFQGLPKQDKMELIIQKCTELGVKTFVPIEMERSIVKLDDKTSEKKLERWQKIAKEASRTKPEGRKFPKFLNQINLNLSLKILKNMI